MDIWFPMMHLAAWSLMSLLAVSSHGVTEVTVRNSDLKPCEEDKRVCVTDLRDCGPRLPASTQETLNMSCFYQISQRSLTCGWSRDWNSHTESDVSLIFSRRHQIFSCPGVFNPSATLNVTARIKNYMLGRETWSRPHAVMLYDVAKPPQPVLRVLGSTEDSVLISWRSSGDGDCRLRYRVNNTHMWIHVPDSVPTRRLDQTLTYRITDLLMSTVYRAAVSCREESGIWSEWSPEAGARTLDRAPSSPPEVCYRVETTDSGSLLLHLMWKDLDLRDAGGRVLGYQVSYESLEEDKKKIVQNTTEVTALLVVEEGNCRVTVAAFNTAGSGPAARLGIAVQSQSALPSVRHLWVSSSFLASKGLLVQWETPTVQPSGPPVSYHHVQWRPETRSSTSSSRWTTVDNVSTSTLIHDVDPDESYLISVIPVYNQRCGSPQSLPASLQLGALMEAVQLKVVGVTKTTVNVTWAWQRKAGPIRVQRYRARLRKDSETQTASLWPDQRQLLLLHLTPNTEYALLLLADEVSRDILPVRTDFDEVPVVAAATPLLLLLLTVFIISILSRTVYKSYFYPPICSPRSSSAGRWLMDPDHQKPSERKVLDLEDFQVTDVLGVKSPITLSPTSVPDLPEDAALLSIDLLIVKMSALEADRKWDAPELPELPLQQQYANYPVYCRHPDAGSTPEERQDAAITCHVHDFVANGVNELTCEVEYVSNTFLGRTDV